MRYLLHDVFLKTVKNYPQRTAIQHEFGKSYDYATLNNMANHLSQTLLSIKPKPITQAPFVGILSQVNAYSIAAVLGALKIGAAYVPLDDQSPVERLLKIVNNLKLDTIVIDAFFFEKFRELLDHNDVKHIIVICKTSREVDNCSQPPTYRGLSAVSRRSLDAADKPQQVGGKINSQYSLGALQKNIITINISQLAEHTAKEPPIINQVSDDLAYILHSSGSTGTPKGIMLTHRNARTFVDWMQKEFQLHEHDKVMSRAPFKFDLSVFDIFNTFAVGATLVCYDWYEHRDSPQRHLDYVSLLEQSQATFLYTTPSTLITLLNHGQLGKKQNSLRTIMYAGEPFPIPQIKQLKSALPTVKIANIYGPTETNIITYYWVNEIADDAKAIPLGDVVDDTEILVVDPEEKRLCQANELGELWCRGGTVTLGYLGDEAKTAEHLVQSPFHPYPTKFWRTGDYGFRDEQGCLHYRGRRDHMVKIKGYRIELGEIESAIAHLAPLDEFCVVAIKEDLACIYSTKSKQALSATVFISHLKQYLPSYMVPSQFHFMLELPKTSSGKIDRVLLGSRLGPLPLS